MVSRLLIIFGLIIGYYSPLLYAVTYDDGDGLINSTWTPPVENADGTPFADPNLPTQDELIGYKYYCGPVNGPYEVIRDISIYNGDVYTALEFPVDIVPSSDLTIHECYVTAYDRSGNESDRSNIIQWAIDKTSPASPTNLKISVTVNIEVR